MKKGFTLIELLAVIVILAIIALIATPIVLNIINDTKKSATIITTENYLEAVEFSIAKNMLTNEKVKDGLYIVNENGNLCSESSCETELVVDAKNKKPDVGSKIEIRNGKVVYENTVLKLDNYSCFKENKIKCLNANIDTIFTAKNFFRIDTKDKNNLYDYKIYGNSVTSTEGIEIESVGDKTSNLYGGEFDTIFELDNFIPANTIIRATGDNTSSQCYISLYDINKNEISEHRLSSTSNNRRFIDIRPPVDIHYIKFYNAKLPNLSLVIGNDNGYEPYGYKIPVKVNSKNLFEDTSIVRKSNVTYENGIATQVMEDTNQNIYFKLISYQEFVYVSTINIKQVTSTGRISFNFTKDDTFNRISFGVNGAKIDSVLMADVSTLENGKTYTLSYNILNITQGEISWNEIQIEEGDTSTEYEPYKEKIYNIYLDEPLRKVDDYADYIDFANKKVVRNVEITNENILKVLDTPKVEDIDLPNIELYEGINYLEIDTKVKPSKTIIKYYK